MTNVPLREYSPPGRVRLPGRRGAAPHRTGCHHAGVPAQDRGGERPFGSRILGRAAEPVSVLRVRVQSLLTGAVLSANVLGAASVVVLHLFVVPRPSLIDTDQRILAMVLAPVYFAVATVVGTLWGTKRELRRLSWLTDERDPTPEDQRATLRTPARLLRLQAVLWFGAVVVFGVLSIPGGWRVVVRTELTIALAGIVTCTISYLLSEVALRPIVARALGEQPDEAFRAPGLASRSLLGWFVGTGVPLSGVAATSLVALTEGGLSTTQLARTTLGVTGITMVTGVMLQLLAVRGVIDPLQGLQRALRRVERGDLSTRIVVYDGSEIGRLQVAFNRMVEGLEERERLHHLFSGHVGDEVARAALAHGVRLGGEQCEASTLFVDIIGSTALGERLPPETVVAVLNAFFEHVVAAVDAEGGWVNKFEGDAALCVFGPPDGLGDHQRAALRAARALRVRLDRLSQEFGVEAAIGVASGTVVAGHVGSTERYEYTVIGDPVNVAARLCELAKQEPCCVLATAVTVAAAGPEEAVHWEGRDPVVLRGRSAPTSVSALRPVPPSARP